MRWEFEWQDGASNAVAEERATVADLHIEIGDQNVCEFRLGSEPQLNDHIALPLYVPAEALARHWWRIMGGRGDAAFSLRGHRNGYLVPDLQIRCTGPLVEIDSKEFVYWNERVRFINSAKEAIAREEAERELGRIVQATIDKLSQSGLAATFLHEQWARVEASRRDPAETVFCEAAGALGLDPYAINEEAAWAIERAGALFDGEVLLEFLAGAKPDFVNGVVLDWVNQRLQEPHEARRVPFVDDLKSIDALRKARARRPGERPWGVGYRVADFVRRELDVKAGKVADTPMSLAKIFGNNEFESTQPVTGVRALISRHGDHTVVHLPAREPSDAVHPPKVFSLARALGDALCFPDTPRSIVNGLDHADRQATGRAFAAEFLAPSAAVTELRGRGLDEEDIALELGVSEKVVGHQIQNASRIRDALAA